jgi:hypothetical protein
VTVNECRADAVARSNAEIVGLGSNPIERHEYLCVRIFCVDVLCVGNGWLVPCPTSSAIFVTKIMKFNNRPGPKKGL